MIADEVAEKLSGNAMFSMVESCKAGIFNLKLDEAYLADYVAKMQADFGRYGCEKTKEPKTIMIDYGGPNVAKPSHVGHLRSAIIGESIKRIGRFMGHTVIGDASGRLGLYRWDLSRSFGRESRILYIFDESYTGEYPAEAPFTISELEEIHPTASGKSNGGRSLDGEAAMQATYELQHGRRLKGTASLISECVRHGLKAQL